MFESFLLKSTLFKKALYLKENGSFLIDKKGNKIVENYQRFIPDFSSIDTWIAILYIIIGIALIVVIDFYGRKRK